MPKNLDNWVQWTMRAGSRSPVSGLTKSVNWGRGRSGEVFLSKKIRIIWSGGLVLLGVVSSNREVGKVTYPSF